MPQHKRILLFNSPCSPENRVIWAEGRLIATTGVTYEYNAMGERVARDTAGVPQALFLHDGVGNQIAELNAARQPQHVNVYAGSHLIGTLQSDGVHYAYSDWLGTKRYEAGPQGGAVNSWASLPFGDSLTPQVTNGPDATEQHFTGKEHDAESGLDSFGARYYQAQTGRWLLPDWSATPVPVPYAVFSNPQSLNLYTYVGNNPVNAVDPDGHTGQGDGNTGVGNNPFYINGNPNCGQFGVNAPAGSPCVVDDGALPSTAEQKKAADDINLSNAAQQTSTSGTTSIQTVSVTSAVPTMVLGGIIGEAIDPAGGGVAGALLGSTVGVGAGVSYVPSTDSWYAGPTASFSPVLLSGTGVSASSVIVPSGQNPDSIANGKSFSVTLQPTPLTGTTIVKSPGSGPPVAGPSVGTKVPIAFGASYNFNITPAVNAARSFVNNAINTVRSWFQ